MLRKKLVLFPRGLCHPTDEYIIYILQESQLKYGVPTIEQPKPYSASLRAVTELKWGESNYFYLH